MENNNTIKIYTTSSGAELSISAPSTKQIISATNNRAQYYAEQAKLYRDEAKLHRDNAKYYSEQNSDVTFEYINEIRASLEDSIATKQDSGNYALKEDLPTNVSELENDAEYINRTIFDEAVDILSLPEQENCSGKFLMTDGTEEHWVGITSFQLFDTKICDHQLNETELLSWALQGTYVYKEAIAGSRYGYPDFYNKVLEEYNASTNTETINGIEVKVHSNGHKFYDIANKTAIDDFFNSMGSAWFYGVDEENERVFLPRNNYFEQATGEVLEVGESVGAGLPNITGTFTFDVNTTEYYSGGWTGAFTKTSAGSQGSSGDGVESTKASFDASRSSNVYGNSDTVQPNAVKKLLYICVGNTVSNISWVDVVTQVEDGVKDIDDAVNAGLVRLNTVDALKTSQITNCITEIPQRIKLELADGVLTLKTGSTVIVPNGAGVFDEVEISEDLTVTYTGSASGEGLLFYDTSANNIQLRWLSNQVGSGTSVPTSSYWLYYSTDENKVYNITNGVSTQASFPVGVFEVASSGSGITSINQIFNGIGYIGSTIWVDKGVKVLVPNGRNEDGSLNNIEYTTELVKVRTETATNLKNGYILLSKSNGLEGQAQTTGEQTRYYDEQRNLYFNGSKYISRAIIGTQSTDSNVKITHLKPKMAFHSVDFNDSGIVAGWGMPSNRYIDLSLGATGSTYKAPANGWFTFNRRWGTGTYSGLRCLDPNGVELYGFQTDDRSTSNSGGEIVFTLPVKKGNYGKVTYNTTGVTEYFRFIYAEGEI